jgi:hypothetical protein
MINIRKIWENHIPTGDIIIKTKIDDIPHLNCFVATNHLTGQHLYIMAVAKTVTIPDLKSYRFKGVEIYSLQNEKDNKIEFYIYLIDNDLKDIFSLFIQNVLEDIEPCISESEAITKTLNVVAKWKKLFDKINFNGLTLEQQKGLIGELLFLNYLLNTERTSVFALDAWTGSETDFKAKDFTIGSIGVEIKFSTSKQPRIKVSNERQLDSENLNALFLVLFTAEAVKDNGISLNSIVESTRQNISTEEGRNLFNSKLQLYGYFEVDKEQYCKMYSINKTLAFSVTSNFPRILKSQLPMGVYDTSYSIEISAVEKFMINFEELLSNV